MYYECNRLKKRSVDLMCTCLQPQHRPCPAPALLKQVPLENLKTTQPKDVEENGTECLHEITKVTDHADLYNIQNSFKYDYTHVSYTLSDQSQCAIQLSKTEMSVVRPPIILPEALCTEVGLTNTPPVALDQSVRCIIVVGVSGAGKSTLARRLRQPSESVLVEADVLRQHHALAARHGKSALKRLIGLTAIKRRQPLWVVTKRFDEVLVRQARSRGYTIDVMAVLCPLNLCQKRMKGREKLTGRPASTLTKEKFTQTICALTAYVASATGSIKTFDPFGNLLHTSASTHESRAKVWLDAALSVGVELAAQTQLWLDVVGLSTAIQWRAPRNQSESRSQSLFRPENLTHPLIQSESRKDPLAPPMVLFIIGHSFSGKATLRPQHFAAISQTFGLQDAVVVDAEMYSRHLNQPSDPLKSDDHSRLTPFVRAWKHGVVAQALLSRRNVILPIADTRSPLASVAAVNRYKRQRYRVGVMHVHATASTGSPLYTTACKRKRSKSTDRPLSEATASALTASLATKLMEVADVVSESCDRSNPLFQPPSDIATAR